MQAFVRVEAMLEHIIHSIGSSCLVVGQANLVPMIACSFSVLGRICNIDAGAMPAEARTA